MRKTSLIALIIVLLLALLTGCESSTSSGARTSSGQDAHGGYVHTTVQAVNGTTTEEIEVEGGGGLTLDSSVALTVEEGSFTIELLDDDGQVTLSLSAGSGETVSGLGTMVVDTFGEAEYRTIATEARGVEYRIDYTFR